MRTITNTMKSGDLITALNQNFNEAAAGGGTPGGSGDMSTLTRTVYVQMQAGSVDTSTGVPVGRVTSNFFRKCVSALMMNVENCTLSSVTVDSGVTLTILCYNASYGYLGTSSSVNELQTNTAYVRFMLSKTSDFSNVPTLPVVVSGVPSFSKNDLPTKVQLTEFSYEVKMTTFFDGDGNSYIGSSSRYWDNAYLKLPPNYTPNGSPVPLVVFVHGTSGYSFQNGPGTSHDILQNFIVNNGYAFCCCCGNTSKYPSLGEPYGFMTVPASVKSMVEHITSNFNVSKDVYIYGKSSGGFVCVLPSLLESMNVRAAAALAPALSTMVSLQHHANTYTSIAQAEVSQFVSGATITTSFRSDSTQTGYITNNIDKFRQLDPFFMGTDMSDDEVRTVVQAMYNKTGSGGFYYLNMSNVASYTTGEISANTGSTEADEILDSASRIVPCPIKIWVARDDGTVFLGNSYLFTQMARRAGQPCYLRMLPSGKGAHHATDATSGTIEMPVTLQTKYGGSMETAIAFAEMVDWFNQW